MDAVLAALRQESRQEVLDLCLDQVLEQLKDIRDRWDGFDGWDGSCSPVRTSRCLTVSVPSSCRPSLSQQYDLLDQLPAVLMEELYAYSNAVSSFFRLSHRHRPVTTETHRRHPGRFLSLTCSHGLFLLRV